MVKRAIAAGIVVVVGALLWWSTRKPDGEPSAPPAEATSADRAAAPETNGKAAGRDQGGAGAAAAPASGASQRPPGAVSPELEAAGRPADPPVVTRGGNTEVVPAGKNQIEHIELQIRSLTRLAYAAERAGDSGRAVLMNKRVAYLKERRERLLDEAAVNPILDPQAAPPPPQ